ncbi:MULTISPECIES: hypothetical protein [unclassified Shinella]|uniref:hypothetical protein n=1 Tax=unclassified Shinella TaxID=2643062 RepID=UPI00225DAC62|nr:MULTISPECIES: hypothetical protein [unclassified Shinella]MCO5153689.1 hypothetical protein [Shinella sp.]MDC7259946.1 hypothetical protein [Shinella sp. YE25]CAI0341702.1 hypothetical protein SHINE37_80092 [Rhizobiaceae bacterium]CAK7262018.1 protein of unknown function [Shinella sp. WSC3-e]
MYFAKGTYLALAMLDNETRTSLCIFVEDRSFPAIPRSTLVMASSIQIDLAREALCAIEVRPHSAIGNKPPIALMNGSGVPHPP